MRYVVLLLGLAFVAPAWADPPAAAKKPEVKKPAPPSFMRLKRDAKDQALALETSIVRYVPASGEGSLTVDLIGAVHIGDRAYYQKLNKQFEQYDVLLYELVAPQGTRVPKGGKRNNSNPIAMLQQMATVALDLDSQLEQIDYTKKNFVHADLSPEGMAEAIRKRGDTGMTVVLGVVTDMLRQANKNALKKFTDPTKKEEDIDLTTLLIDPEGAVKLKRVMAAQFADMDTEGGLGNTLGTILVSDRNKAAIKVLQKEIAKGKKIGIFYGAAHMPDFDKRLREEFDLKRGEEKWLTAWDLKKPTKKKGFFDMLKMLDD